MRGSEDNSNSSPLQSPSEDNMLTVLPQTDEVVFCEVTTPEKAKEDMKSIDRLITSVSRSVNALCRMNAVASEPTPADILKSIEMDEENIFGPVPESLLQDHGKVRASGRLSTRTTASNCNAVAAFHGDRSGYTDRTASHRIVIDPFAPLPTMFDQQRKVATKLQKSEARGTYHSLFFDDEEPLIFTPPENSKRKEIEKLEEDKMYWKKKFQRSIKEKEPRPKKKMTVVADFVPACAAVDHSLIQEKLHEKKREEKSRVIKRFTLA